MKASTGTTSLSSAIYARLSQNADLLIEWYGSGSQYQSEGDRDRADRNINSVLGELDLLAKGMNEQVPTNSYAPS